MHVGPKALTEIPHQDCKNCNWLLVFLNIFLIALEFVECEDIILERLSVVSFS